MKKKGDFMVETAVKIVIAVICIALLMYLAFRFGGLFNSKTDVQQASAHLENIEKKINLLKPGENFTYFLNSPPEWYLVSWSREKTGFIPNLCSNSPFDKCLCICSGTTISSCDEFGRCSSMGENYEVSSASWWWGTNNYIQIKDLIKDSKKIIVSRDYSGNIKII